MEPIVEEAAVVEPTAVEEVRVAAGERTVRAAAKPGAARIGIVAANQPFRVLGRVDGPGCGDWGRVERGGYVCLDGTAPAAEAPTHLPEVEGGQLPYVYARLARGYPGPIYASVAAFERGAKPVAWFEPEHSYRFVATVPTARGDVLVAPDGRVVPAAQAKLYEPAAFAGRDLAVEPLPEGATLAWCVEADGCPTADGGALAYQEDFLLGTVVFDGEPRVRAWRPAARPEGVGAEERWIDVDLAEQTLAIVRGDTPEYVTLISAGIGGRYTTPRGSWRITDKMVENDMRSLPDAADAYHVEAVPWVAHFKPRFALHGAYWHDGFGRPRSHGCVNLAPADAHRVFDALTPTLPDGWRAVWATEDEPGTWIRIR